MNEDQISDLCLKVYRARLDADNSPGAADRMVAKDGDKGEKQRRRSDCYRPIVTETLVQLGLHQRPVYTPRKKNGKGNE